MKKIPLLLFIILLLTACTEVTHNSYTFAGESTHWEAQYFYKGTEKWGNDNGTRTYSNKDRDEFVLKYKGSLEELSSIKKLEYSYKTISGSGKSTHEFTEPPTELTFTSASGSVGGAKVSEDEVIQVNVKWDDFEESFELHNKNKNK